MSNKGKRHNKRWLISRLKTSGSKKRYAVSEDYSETRNSKKRKNWEDLPTIEGIGQSFKFFNSKINYGLLIRFLRGKNGSNWDEVQKEVSERIPSNLSEYRDCLKWFVADLIEKRENGLWDKREQKYILTDLSEDYNWNIHVHKQFYVDPDSNVLVEIEDFPSKRKTKGMSPKQIQRYRENKQKKKIAKRQSKKVEQQQVEEKVKEILKNKTAHKV